MNSSGPTSRDSSTWSRSRVDAAQRASTDDASARSEAGYSESAREATVRAERYQVSFTASQTYVDLLERAQALLSHAVPQRSLEEVHLRALSLLVELLEKRKYGAPRKPSPEAPAAEDPGPCAKPPQAKQEACTRAAPARRSGEARRSAGAPERRSGTAAARREVRDRDGTQCAFVDERGQRCRETRFLELHHELAYALGGQTAAHNLKLYCQAHNALAAERDFGREFMKARGGPVAESRRAARPPT